MDLKLEKWIGEETDTSGSYYQTAFEELSKRHGGRINALTLYQFRNRYGDEFYITDSEVIRKIEELLPNYENSAELVEYLYMLVIERFGILHFLHRIELHIAAQRDVGWKNGKAHLQKEMRKLLGV